MLRLSLALLAVLAAILIFYVRSQSNNGGDIITVRDGDSVTFVCSAPAVASAKYGSASCPYVDVTKKVQDWIDTNRGKPLLVTPEVFGVAPCAQLRELTVEYSCLSKETIIPRRVNTCSPAQNVLPAAMADPDYALHQWSGQDNENWTAAVTPWDPDSKIQLTAAALTAGARQMYRPVNPLTRVGVTDRVLNWDNPYADVEGVMDISASPCSSAVSIYELQPFQPGFLVPKQNESTDGTMAEGRYYYQPAYWSRASGPYGGPYKPVATCPADLGVDANYQVDGQYDTDLVQREMEGMRSSPAGGEFWWQEAGGYQQPWMDDRNERNLAELAGVGPFAGSASPALRSQASFVRPKETLRSRGDYRQVARDDQCLTGIGCGLGSTWIDSRFEPGPQEMYPGGDAIWAQGGHAGGPTFGSLMPYKFQTSGTWNRYVHGFGDGRYVAPTAPRGYHYRA